MADEKEVKFELMVWQLVIAVVVVMFVALVFGFWAGKAVGFSGGVDAVKTVIPDYCSINKQGSDIMIKCNEIGLSLDEVCKITSEGFRSKVKVVSLGGG